MDSGERIIAILDRIVHIPMHQYARYFERFTQVGASRPVKELASPEIMEQLRQEILQESIDPNINQSTKPSRNETEVERELRIRVHNIHLLVFSKTQMDTTKRWVYESEIKRPYFHVTELEEAQLVNWRRYLDYEEIEGNPQRIQFLYERCVVACVLFLERITLTLGALR